jgi:hypothetical protein
MICYVLDLKSVYGKLGRAEEHFQAVDAEISSWMKDCTYSFAFEHNADFTRHAVVLRRVGPDPDLLRWTLIIGDCINNLRISLDHLIYAVAKHETRNNPTCDIEKLAFIIVDKPELFMSKDNRKRLEGLSDEVIDAVRNCQPFIRKHPVLPPALTILRNFSNDDKHRLLRTANSAPTILNLEFTSPRLREDKRIIPISEPIENNAEICVVESPQPDPQLRFKGHSLGMEVALWHGTRDANSDPMDGRTGYAGLLPILISEVKFAIETVRAAVK